MKIQAIVTYIKPGDVTFADVTDFPQMPRVGEMFNIGDFDHEWWRVMEVIYTFRQHEDGPEIALVAEPVEPHQIAIRRKSQTRDG
jgi:hypothetical protein